MIIQCKYAKKCNLYVLQHRYLYQLLASWVGTVLLFLLAGMDLYAYSLIDKVLEIICVV
jgi:hypothetical protein